MRPIWTGTISFGLVNIPVQLYAATKERRPAFKMLHKTDLSPIEYLKICKKNKEEVPKEQIVKGLEFEEGYYIVLDENDFKKADPEKSRAIKILEFFPENEIDPSYYIKPYYLEPLYEAGKAFALFREALKKTRKIAFGQFVLRSKEFLAVIHPKDNLLVLNELRYSDEVLPAKKLNFQEKAEYSSEEVEMAKQLIDKMESHFFPEKYKDNYAEKLREIIKQKSEGKIPAEKIEEMPLVETQDIMEKLKESLEKIRAQK